MTFFLSGDPEPMVVTLGVETGTEDDPSDLADEIFSLWVNAGTIFEPDSFSNEYRIGPFIASIMTATGPQIGTGVNFRQGTNAGIDSTPNNCAVLVQKRTARGGRKGRGRMYVPPVWPTEGPIEANGDIQVLLHASWQVAMTEFLLSCDSAGHAIVLLHSEEAGAIAPDPVTQLVVSPKLATQRTRMRP